MSNDQEKLFYNSSDEYTDTDADDIVSNENQSDEDVLQSICFISYNEQVQEPAQKLEPVQESKPEPESAQESIIESKPESAQESIIESDPTSAPVQEKKNNVNRCSQNNLHP